MAASTMPAASADRKKRKDRPTWDGQGTWFLCKPTWAWHLLSREPPGVFLTFPET